ncbi:MAG: hypothetical protein K2Q21_12935 [Chitinophagaceae bacterium]|nr:hypothetical protein [Chitinophagaceae bacterium]
MKELDIVFNIDYYAKIGSSALHDSMPRYIEYISVNDMEQFRRLIGSLKENIRCYIWVHPSLNSELVQSGMKSSVEIESVPDLVRLQIEFKRMTRSSQKSDNIEIIDANLLLEYRKAMRSYTVRELNKILNPPVAESRESVIRDRVKQSLMEDVSNTNAELAAIRRFLYQSWQGETGMLWYGGIFNGMEECFLKNYSSRYWKFPSITVGKYLNTENPEKDLIISDGTKIRDTIVFDEPQSQWHIDLSFFNEVSSRFEKKDQKDYRAMLVVAACLYVIHEAIHKVHNLDSDTVLGIGNFPRIIEEADYQADAMAVLIQLAYFISNSGGIKKVSAAEIGKKVCDTIQIAIETTFSFNPVADSTKRIQVRRVNRYLIWFWQYFRIKSLLTESLTSSEFLEKLLFLFSVKPNIEITGPAIISSENLDRTFYDLEDIKHRELIGIMLDNNQIIRLAPINNVAFANFYKGMQQSDFEAMLKFLTSMLSNYKSMLGFQISF